MEKRIRLWTMGVLIFTLLLAMTGCGGGSDDSQALQNTAENTVPGQSMENGQDEDAKENAAESMEESMEETGASAVTQLYVQFGAEGAPFVLHLYDNSTAAAIANYVGTTKWQLPIYHYDDFDNCAVMQYYDIPGSYEIPDNAESVTSEQAGDVYYSEPNRIILFYQDAEVSGDYTPVGYFDNTEEFVAAVEENPVLEGWGNKIVLVSAGEQ